MQKKTRRGVSKGEWLEAGLQTLSAGTISDITIEGLARHLGIAKAGFYWHFKNRQDLLNQLLDYWIHETTEVASKNPTLLELEPRARLIHLAEMIVKYDFAHYDMPIRQWALQDAVAARAVRKVDKIRLGFVRSAFCELGFTGDELEMRSMLYVGYQSMESFVFRKLSRKQRRKLIARRVDLLTSK